MGAGWGGTTVAAALPTQCSLPSSWVLLTSSVSRPALWISVGASGRNEAALQASCPPFHEGFPSHAQPLIALAPCLFPRPAGCSADTAVGLS